MHDRAELARTLAGLRCEAYNGHVKDRAEPADAERVGASLPAEALDHDGSPVVRPIVAQLLGLQRAVGNRAVQRLVRREPTQPTPRAEPATVLDASYFSTTGAEPTVDGTTHIEAGRAEGNARVVGPRFAWTETVTVAKDLPGGVGIDVGFQQVMKGSTRTANHQKPAGREVGYTIATPESRDAALGVSGATKGLLRKGEITTAPSGFFSDQSDLGGMARRNLPPSQGSSAEPNMFDVPSWDAAMVRDGAPLVGTTGSDRFHVSLVAKEQGKAPVFLANRQWAVDWSQSVDTNAPGGPTSQGGHGIAVRTTNEGVPQLDGPTPHFLGKAWYQFQSVEAAQSASTDVLMQNLLLASAGGDAQSLGFTVDALRARNPTFKIDVSCTETAAFVGADTVSLMLAGTNRVVRTITLSKGDVQTVTARLLELFPDPGAIGSGSTMSITLAVTSDRGAPSASQSVRAPFLSIPFTRHEVGNVDAGTFYVGGGLW